MVPVVEKAPDYSVGGSSRRKKKQVEKALIGAYKVTNAYKLLN